MTLQNKRVFITRKIHSDGQRLLEDHGIITHTWEHDRPIASSDLYKYARHFDGLITMLTDPIDQQFLMANSHLKVIANYAVGFNNIDIDVASELNIIVANTPHVLTDATAETALGLMIAVGRDFFKEATKARMGLAQGWHPTDNLTLGLHGKTLGVVGFGRIGQRLSEIAHDGFKMKVLYHSRSPKKTHLKNAEQVDLKYLFSHSDYISIHLPLTPQTYHSINFDLFRLMKKNAFIINTARGEIIKQDDLIKALEEDIVAGAGLDVTEPEPLNVDSKLFNFSNVVVLPHIGSATIQTRQEMAIMCAQNIISAFQGEDFAGWVNRKNLHP